MNIFFFLPLVKKCQHKKQVQWGKALKKKIIKRVTLWFIHPQENLKIPTPLRKQNSRNLTVQLGDLKKKKVQHSMSHINQIG